MRSFAYSRILFFKHVHWTFSRLQWQEQVPCHATPICFFGRRDPFDLHVRGLIVW